LTFKLKNCLIKITPLIFLLGLALLSLTWFRGDHLINIADFNFPISPTNQFEKLSYIWTQNDIGSAERSPPRLIFQLPITFLYEVGFSIITVEKIMFVLLLFMMGFSTYKLTYYLLSDEKFAAISGLIAANFYMFNMYTLQVKWSNGYIVSLYVYALLPIIVLYTIKFFNNSNKKNLALLGIFSFLASLSSNNPAYYFPIFAMILGYGTYVMVLSGKTKIRDNIKKIVLIIALISMINIFWILPLFFQVGDITSEVQESDILSSIKNGSANSFADMFRFLGFWVLKASHGGSPYFPYGYIYYTPLFTVVGFSIFLISLICLLKNKNNKFTLFFALVGFASLFLMKGIIPPFSNINIWLYNNFPGFWAFRQPYDKFGIFFIFSVSILLGISVQTILMKIYDTKWLNKKVSQTLVIFIIFILFFSINIYAFPFWTGDIFPEYGENSILKSARINIPNYYEELNQDINIQETEFRILGIPGNGKHTWVPYNWDYLGVDPLYHYSNKSYLLANIYKNDIQNVLFEIEKNPNFIQIIIPLANYLNIKYVVLRNDVDYTFYKKITDPKKIKKQIETSEDFIFVKSYGKLDLYEIESNFFKPKIYPSNNVLFIEGDLTKIPKMFYSNNFIEGNNVFFFSNQTDKSQWEFLETYSKAENNYTPIITIQKTNPTKYHIKLENATQPFFLIFSESYHPQWNVYHEKKSFMFNEIIAEYNNTGVKEARHEKIFTPGDIWYLLAKPISDDKHFIANGYANAWYIDPKELGISENFTIVLYFKQQSYFYIGLIISGITFIGCLGYLVLDWRKKYIKIVRVYL